jgi:ribosomal protein S18 acetylase RimI-like enzyme
MDETTIRAMQSLASEVWRLRPELTNPGLSHGELAWLWGAGHRRQSDNWTHQLWSDGGRTAAFGWIFAPEETIISEGERRMQPASLAWQVHPDRPELLDEVLDWFAEQVPNSTRVTSARDVDAGAVGRLQQHGYVRDDVNAPWSMLNLRDLKDIEGHLLPSGYQALTMREISNLGSALERRVEVHRVAWAPSKLTIEAYKDVMATPPYRDDLDFVIQDDDGTLVASALGWYDEANQVGEFEPVGTHPDYRNRGLGRALLLFGMGRFRAAGATHAAVGCRGDENYPIPKKLYRSVGFKELTREIRYVTE